jgi:hypothetical protein
VCNRYYLEDYIIASKRPFILLIDELDALFYNPDSEAMKLLRDMFLDPKDRYLVYSTRRHLTLDPITESGALGNEPIPRNTHFMDLAASYDLDKLRNISPNLQDLTLEEAQYYGGIPSIIYCSRQSHEIRTHERFKGTVNSEYINVKAEKFIADLIDRILTGSYQLPPKYMLYFEWYSSISSETQSSELKIRWPLVYVAEMMHFMSGFFCENRRKQFSVLSDLSKLIKNDFLGYRNRDKPGTGWEIITKVAILLHCVYAYASDNELTVMNIHFGPITSVNLYRFCHIEVVDKDIELMILDQMKSLKVGAIVMFYPKTGEFPFCEAILVYKSSSEGLKLIAIRDREGREYSKAKLPNWITQVVLIQGNAPESVSGMNIEGELKRLKFLTRVEVDELLGYSLMYLNPAWWKKPAGY